MAGIALAEALECDGTHRMARMLDEARSLFERLLRYANPVGLFSEDVEPRTGALLGNFPQAYTHVGLIHAAFAASPSWAEIL